MSCVGGWFISKRQIRQDIDVRLGPWNLSRKMQRRKVCVPLFAERVEGKRERTRNGEHKFYSSFSFSDKYYSSSVPTAVVVAFGEPAWATDIEQSPL